MSKILNYIKENIGHNESFTAYEVSTAIKINHKVVQMNLKRLHNNETLHYFHSTGTYWLRTEEQIKKKRQAVNDLIDKYGLTQKKYKL